MAEFLPGTIGQRLAELREQRGFTREELAERVGVSTSTLSRLESGQILETAAHFHLTEKRAKKTERDALDNLRRKMPC